MWSLLVLSATISATGFCLTEEYKVNVDECRAAGFNPETLKCGLCERLSDYNLEILITDCQQCCIKEEEFKHAKYPIAILEVCECNLARFPQIQAFVHKDMANQFGGKVRVKHVRGVRPQVSLKDADFKTKEVLSVEKWDTDTLIDFFNQWLE